MMPQAKPEPAKKTKAMTQERNNAHSVKEESCAEVSPTTMKQEQSLQQSLTEPKTTSAYRKVKEPAEDGDERWSLKAKEEEQQRIPEILKSEIVLATCSALYFEESLYSKDP